MFVVVGSIRFVVAMGRGKVRATLRELVRVVGDQLGAQYLWGASGALGFFDCFHFHFSLLCIALHCVGSPASLRVKYLSIYCNGHPEVREYVELSEAVFSLEFS